MPSAWGRKKGESVVSLAGSWALYVSQQPAWKFSVVVFFLNVAVCLHACVQVAPEAERGHQMPRN